MQKTNRPSHCLRPLFAVLCLVCVMTLPAPATAQARGAPPSPMVQRLKQLGGYPCPDGVFTCVKIRVPLDHFGPSAFTATQIEVVFAVLPATGARKGMFVTADGGPGVSGVLAAGSWLSTYDPSIPQHFDLVYFDQRGIGLSGGFQCTEAMAKYYQFDQRADTPAQKAALIDADKKFAADCAKMLGRADRLPFYGTRQAVEDLEAFRQLIGDNQIWLYGDSYGTEYAQAYAAAHADHLAALVLDGTVDLTRPGVDYLQNMANGFNDTLTKTLHLCDQTPACAADYGLPALGAYDALSAMLYPASATVPFPLPNGSSAARPFTFSNLEVVANGQMYSEGDRMLFQRALGYAARDQDLAPLLRLFYLDLGVDETTLVPQVNLAYSDAAYYAVNCNDYPYFAGLGTPEQRALMYLNYNPGGLPPRMQSLYHDDLPCVFWPRANPTLVPLDPAPALNALHVPVLVLGATADPATPLSNGAAVFARLNNASLITTLGGPHVTFDWGNPCPDVLVTAFLVKGTPPANKQTVCDGGVATAYVPLAPVAATSFADVLAAMWSADTEINVLPEYYYWDGVAPASAGCPRGGAMAFAPSAKGYNYGLTSCAFSAGFVMTGKGAYDTGADRFTLTVTVSGDKSGTLAYTRTANDISVKGTYGGKPVNLHRRLALSHRASPHVRAADRIK